MIHLLMGVLIGMNFLCIIVTSGGVMNWAAIGIIGIVWLLVIMKRVFGWFT